MIFRKRFTIKACGENRNELIAYLKYNANNIIIKGIEYIGDGFDNGFYLIDVTASMRDYKKLKNLKDIEIQ